MSFANNKTKPNNIDLDSSQTLDNKTLAPSTVIQSGATITTPQIIDPSRLDVKKDTLANLQTYASSATNGQFVFATDTKTMFQVVDGALTGVGGGSANVNYAEGDSSNFENGVGDWVEQTVDLSISQDLVSPLRGNASGKVAKGMNGVVNYVSLPFTIDSADLAKILTISFDKSTSANYSDSGDNNFYIRVYDEDKSAEIRGHGEEILAGEGVHSYRFQTDAASTNYSLRIYCNDPSATIYDMVFDNVVIGPQVLSYGSLITDWITGSCTSSWTGTTTTCKYRRIGDTAEIQYRVEITSSPSGGSLSSSLPDGLIANETKMELNSTRNEQRIGIGYADNGTTVYNLGVTWLGNSNVVLPTRNTDGNANAENDIRASSITTSAPFSASVGDVYSYTINIPIQGWSSNAVSSEDLGGRDVIVEARGNGETSITSNTTDIDFTETRDTTSSWDGTTFTAPSTGEYIITGGTRFTAGVNAAIRAYINGTGDRFVGVAITNDQQKNGISGVLTLTKGDELTFRSSANGTLVNDSSLHWIHIQKLASPQTILETETVAARYTTNAGQGLTNGADTTIVYEDVYGDTHNAMNTLTGEYTVPVNGWYDITAQNQLAGGTLTGILLLSIVVNGTVVGRGDVITVSNSELTAGVNDKIPLNKGDIVRIDAFQTTGSATLQTESARNHFSIARIK